MCQCRCRFEDSWTGDCTLRGECYWEWLERQEEKDKEYDEEWED